MTGFAGLIKQRRRWLNGTFFAMIYTLSNWQRIWTESHHRCLHVPAAAACAVQHGKGSQCLLWTHQLPTPSTAQFISHTALRQPLRNPA